MRPNASSFFFFFFSSSIKHIWLRAVGDFGFWIHLDFLVEVVVVLKAVGGGGCGCGFLDLPLVVVELGFGVARFEDVGNNHILLCSVSGWVHHFGKK